MALRKHWLDDVFDKASATDSLRSAFLDEKKTEAAFAMAVAEYELTKKHCEEHPNVLGATPAQAALSKWLEVMELRRNFPDAEP